MFPLSLMMETFGIIRRINIQLWQLFSLMEIDTKLSLSFMNYGHFCELVQLILKEGTKNNVD